LEAEPESRPGLAEVAAVWALFAVVALEVAVTYARLPPGELYNTDVTGLPGGAGRALVFLNYPAAFAAIAVAVIVAERLRRRWAWILAGVSVLLSAAVAWPDVVRQSDLDARPVNAIAGAGVALALALTLVALARGGLGRVRPFQGWDWLRLALAALILAASLPWLAAEAGFTLEGVPGLGALFLTGEPFPEPGHPELTAVHLGHHHGMDGALLALTALALWRVLPDVRAGLPRLSLGVYLALMLAYGLANAVQDFWLEQLVKRGATTLEIPSLIIPKASPAWAALLASALLIHLLASGVGRFDSDRQEGVP
jgi:hypothetical protein